MPRGRFRLLRLVDLGLRVGSAIAITVILLVLGLASFAVGSPAAARWLVDRVVLAAEGRLAVDSLSGSLWSGLAAERLRYRDDAITVEVSGLWLGPGWRGLLAGKFTLKQVRADLIELELAIDPPGRLPGAKPPLASLALATPFPVELADLTVERLEFKRGEIRRTFDAVRLAGEIDASRYRIERAGGISEGISLSAGDLLLAADRAPFRIQGWMQAEGTAAALAVLLGVGPIGPDPAEHVQLDAALSGALDQLMVAVTARAWGANLEAQTAIRLLDSPLAVEVSGSVRDWATQRVLPGGPKALLDGRFEFSLPRQTFSADFQNRQPASLSDGGLPIRRLSLAGDLDAERLRVQRISAAFVRVRDPRPGTEAGRAPAAVEAGQVDGQISILFGKERFIWGVKWPELSGRLVLGNLDLRAIGAHFPATRIAGPIGLEAGRFSAVLEDRGYASAPIRLDLLIAAELTGLRVDRAQAELAGSRVTAEGRIGQGPQPQLALKGRFQSIDTQLIGSLFGQASALPEGDLSGAWQISSASGAQAGGLGFGLDLAPNSRLAGTALTGAASGQWSPGRLSALDLRLAQGQDRLAAQGSLGGAGDQLKIDLRVANLERHLPGLRGPARLTGHLGGGFDDLRVGLALDAGPIEVVQSQRPELRGLALKASLTGTPTAHRIDIDLSTRPERLRLSGTGGWIQAASNWQARVDGLRLDGTLPATLVEPFDVSLASGSLELRGLELAVSQGRLRFETVDWREGRLKSAGALTGLSLATLADGLDAAQRGSTLASANQAGAPQADKTTREAIARLRSLQAQGEWSLEGASWQQLSGSASLEIKPNAAAANQALEPGLAESRLNLRLDEGRLAGEARLTVPSLAFSRRLTAPDWVADGSLAFEGRIGGSLALPELEGLLTGQSLSLANRSLGWRLRDGSLSARFDGRQLQIDSLRFASGDQGVVELLGRISPPTSARTGVQVSSSRPSAPQTAGAPFDADLDLRLQRFVVPLDPGQRLLLSGRTRLVAREGAVNWSGAVKAEEGLIEFRSGGAPEMPADLVIVDRRVPAPQVEKRIAPPQVSPAATTPEWTPVVQADIRIELGERLRVQGGGLDARLTGELVLSGRLPQDPRVHGRVQLRDGTFAAYGRKLALSRGELRFNGEVDNPALDIVAMRNNMPVSAGVAVTGLARSPRVRLVSEPDVPDAQKLSWLVLGTGLEDAAAAGQALALREAALTLLGDDDGGMVAGLSQAFGLDAIGFGRAASGAPTSLERSRLGPPGLPSTAATASAGGAVREEVLSVSKRLNSRLTVNYERGIHGIWNLVRLQYEISNRLSLRAQSGSENAVDLLYFWWFD